MNKIRLVSFRFDSDGLWLWGRVSKWDFIYDQKGLHSRGAVLGERAIHSEIPAAGHGKSVAVALAKHCTKSMQLHERGSEADRFRSQFYYTRREN